MRSPFEYVFSHRTCISLTWSRAAQAEFSLLSYCDRTVSAALLLSEPAVEAQLFIRVMRFRFSEYVSVAFADLAKVAVSQLPIIQMPGVKVATLVLTWNSFACDVVVPIVHRPLAQLGPSAV